MIDTFHQDSSHNPGFRSRGVYTLLIIIILLGVSMILVRGLLTSSIQETRSTLNDEVAHEVFHAAEAAMDYGIAWYTVNEPDWSSAPAYPDPPMDPVPAPNGDTYLVTTTFIRDPAQEGFILVTGTATAAGDPAITASVRQYIHSNILLRDRSFVGPPLLVNGCFGHITGTSEIHLLDDPNDPEPIAVSNAGMVTQDDGTPCLDQGHLDYCLEEDCSDGAVDEDMAEDYGSLFTNGDELWDALFDLPREDMKVIADNEVASGVPDEERNVVWVTSTDNYHRSWGTPDNPVIVVFAPEADCPRLNGSPTFYGVVFVDSPCDDSQGWGGTEVYGTVAINGDLEKFSANTVIHDWGRAGGNEPELPKADFVARIPGTWRDFEAP